MEALERADLHAVKEALRAGADPETQDDQGKVALLLASEADLRWIPDSTTPMATSAQLVELLLDHGADRRSLHGSLHWAVQVGRADLVRAFLVEPIEEDVKQLVPAYLRAADRGDEATLDALLASGLRPDGKPTGSPLVNALEAGRRGIFDRFVEHGLWLDSKEVGRTALHVAAARGETEALAKLLAAGAQVDLAGRFMIRSEATAKGQRFEDSTALHVAARYGQAAMVTSLLSAGADAARRGGAGRTALDWARELEHAEIVIALEAIVGDRNLPADLQLCLAAEQGDSTAVTEALRRGAKVDTRDQRKLTRGMTAAMLAAQGGHLEALEALVEADAAIDLHDDPKGLSRGAELDFESHESSTSLREMGFAPRRTALHYASEMGHEAVVSALLTKGAPNAVRDFRGLTPLHLAAQAGHRAVVCVLVRGGAKVESTDADGQAPLHLAANAGQLEAARELLIAGAQAEQADEYGATPLSLAEPGRHRSLLELLLTPPKNPGGD